MCLAWKDYTACEPPLLLLIVFQLAERGARTTAASDDAPAGQPGSDDLQPEALEGSTDSGDGVDAATQTVKRCTFPECDLLRLPRPVPLWHGCLRRSRRLQMKRRTSWSAAGAGRPGRPTTWERTPSETSRRCWTVSWINLKPTCGTSQFGMESETVGSTQFQRGKAHAN